ncbi:MAG TPA: hypothetical protein G4N92_04040 [Anaerolineae bacterium]|nr:hypothetical protein [Anaerolineae bacterium]
MLPGRVMKSRDLLIGILLTLAAVGQIVLGFVFYNSQGSDLWRNIGWGIGYLSAIFGWLPMYELKKRGGSGERTQLYSDF